MHQQISFKTVWHSLQMCTLVIFLGRLVLLLRILIQHKQQCILYIKWWLDVYLSIITTIKQQQKNDKAAKSVSRNITLHFFMHGDVRMMS